MRNRFKIILFNKSIYREIELSPDMQSLSIGTMLSSDIRLRKELFFEPFRLSFSVENDGWAVYCSDNIYMTAGDVRKLAVKNLAHGDELAVKYQKSDSEVFRFSFVIDFDYETKNYDLSIDIASLDELRIGGTPNCQIYLTGELIGIDQFAVLHTDGRHYLQEISAKYGIRLNGKRIRGKTELRENDFISFCDYSFCYQNGCLLTDRRAKLKVDGLKSSVMEISRSSYQYPRFNRSARIRSVIPNDKIPILAPPAVAQKPTSNLIMQLLPAVAMLALVVLLRGSMGSGNSSFLWISAFSVGIGVLTSVASIITDQKKYKKEKAERVKKYTDYIKGKKEQIVSCRNEEKQLLNEKYYSVKRELGMIRDFSADLFNRNPQDEDYLDVFLGTGRLEAIRKIDYQQQEKLEVEDDLARVPEEIAEEFRCIDDIPVVLSLKKNSATGIVGPEHLIYGLLKNITLDLAVRQYYGDLKLLYIIGEEDRDQFRWIRLLPHVRNDILGIRNIVCDGDSKNILFEFLYKELSRRETQKVTSPNVVVFVYRDMGIRRHPISKFVEKAAELGVSFVFFEQSKDFVPSCCSDIVMLEDQHNGSIISAADYTKVRRFEYAPVSDDEVEKAVAKLAPVYCEEVSLEGTLTKNITLFELLNILSVDDIDLGKNWSESQVYRSMAAPLGVKAKNQIEYLDLNEKNHGPHGLVAGTTGSGKSEILQTYILSMALLFHPYEVGFVIIDFKGGGMVNQFKNLPHLIGAITNIDGREINRSLISIKAELNKRQELFAQYQVNHIDAYIKKYKKGETKIPLPHLILIVDEFAELKTDQPEFMKELISAARIGRSLGIHLILATQKPSGVVDAQIWSNSRFKLCLKVQNKEDSNEVLKTPLAAEIKEPGRAYLQVGNNEVFELFQSAYSGGPASADDTDSGKSFTMYRLDLSGKKTPVYSRKAKKMGEERETQLTAIVNYISAYCTDRDIARLPGICLPPLADRIVYPGASPEPFGTGAAVPVGIYDDPANQNQSVVRLGLLSGNTVVIGSSQCGKTNLLQLIVRAIADRYSPRDVNVYILDFGSMALKVFNSLCHVGGVVLAAEDEKLKNFFKLMNLEMKKRKETFATLGITSFSSYREAGYSDIPQIVVLIDNFLGLRELYPDYDDNLLSLVREGASVGLCIVMTSLQTSGIGYKYMSNFPNRICLYCNQSDEYGTLFDRCRMQPKNTPGRGLVLMDKVVYEYQTYLAFKGEKEIDRVKAIQSFIEEKNQVNAGLTAKKIPEVPGRLDQKYVQENIDHDLLQPYCVPVGIDYDSVEFFLADLSSALTIGISGRSGNTEARLLTLLLEYCRNHASDCPVEGYLIDDYDRKLDSFSTAGFVRKYSVEVGDFETTLNEMADTLQLRKEKVRESGIAALTGEPLLLCVVRNSNVFTEGVVSGRGVDLYKRIVKDYRQFKVLFIFGSMEDTAISYSAPDLLKCMKELRYLFLCEDLSKVRMVDINMNTIRRFTKPIEEDDCYVVAGDDNVSRLKIIQN